MAPRISRRARIGWLAAGGFVLVAGVIAAFVFQPWLLFIDVEVADDIPAAVATATPSASTAPGATPEATASATPPPAPGPVRLSSGTFISHEHETTGTASIIELPDGSRQLALESLATTNGPDVHVWLSAGPVIEGAAGWFTAINHPYVDLGPIKGNLGDQLYDIPADVDLGVYRAVDLWCVQFSVSFGAAALA